MIALRNAHVGHRELLGALIDVGHAVNAVG